MTFSFLVVRPNLLQKDFPDTILYTPASSVRYIDTCLWIPHSLSLANNIIILKLYFWIDLLHYRASSSIILMIALNNTTYHLVNAFTKQPVTFIISLNTVTTL